MSVEVDNSVAWHHERVCLRNIPKFEWLEYVMVLHERYACRSVVQPIVSDVQRGVFDLPPGVRLSLMFKIVFKREIQLEVECVAISADATRICVVDVFLHMRKQYCGVRVVNFRVSENVRLRSVQQLPRILSIDRPVNVVEHKALYVLCCIDPQPIDSDNLNEPLSVSHQVSGVILNNGITSHRVLQVECVYWN